VNKGHGRIERRHLQASTRLPDSLNWPGIKQVCRIERTVQRAGKTTREVAYAITSLSREKATAEQLLQFNRGHWAIENRLHWVRDVVMGEDKCRAKKGHSPQNLAALRNLGLSLLRLAGLNEIKSTIREFTFNSQKLLQTLHILKN